MIILPWYAIYITAELDWRKSCMDYLGKIIYANLENLYLF